MLIRISRWLEKFLYHHADALIVNSPGFIPHVYQNGAKKVYLVPNGVDTSMFSTEEDGSFFRAVHHWQNKFLVFYTGAHGMSNDLSVVINAAEQLKDKKDIHFVFKMQINQSKSYIIICFKFQLDY